MSRLPLKERAVWKTSAVSDSVQSVLQKQITKPKRSPPVEMDDENLIRVLQDPRSSASLKLDAVDALNSKSSTELRRDLTFSGEGQLTWNANNATVFDCLTRLFNSELVSKRTLREESALMRGKTQRFVFWYTKDWAIHISEEIKKCGGKAEFVKAY